MQGTHAVWNSLTLKIHLKSIRNFQAFKGLHFGTAQNAVTIFVLILVLSCVIMLVRATFSIFFMY